MVEQPLSDINILDKKRYSIPIVPNRGTAPLSYQKEVQHPYRTKNRYRTTIVPKTGTGPLSYQKQAQIPWRTKKSYRTQKKVQHPYRTKKRCNTPMGGTAPLSYQKEVQHPYRIKKRYSTIAPKRGTTRFGQKKVQRPAMYPGPVWRAHVGVGGTRSAWDQKASSGALYWPKILPFSRRSLRTPEWPPVAAVISAVVSRLLRASVLAPWKIKFWREKKQGRTREWQINFWRKV